MQAGNPAVLGASPDSSGTNFALYSAVAERVELCLFDDQGHQVQCIDLPEREEERWEQPAGPEAAHLVEWSDRWGQERKTRFHLDAAEIRTFEGSFLKHGPATSWFRLLYPLVEGEEDTPFVRLATVADMSNGNSQALDPRGGAAPRRPASPALRRSRRARRRAAIGRGPAAALGTEAARHGRQHSGVAAPRRRSA